MFNLRHLFTLQDRGLFAQITAEAIKQHGYVLGKRMRSIQKRHRIQTEGTSRYTPAGVNRNCGDRGINPKSFERRQA